MLLQIAINATYQLSNEDINYFSKCLFPLAWWHSNNDWLLAFASEHEFNQINYLASTEENLEKMFWFEVKALVMFSCKNFPKPSVQDWWILILKKRTILQWKKSGEVCSFGRKCNKNQFQIGLKVLSCPAFFCRANCPIFLPPLKWGRSTTLYSSLQSNQNLLVHLLHS